MFRTRVSQAIIEREIIWCERQWEKRRFSRLRSWKMTSLPPLVGSRPAYGRSMQSGFGNLDGRVRNVLTS